MEKFELDGALAAEIRDKVFGDGFIKIVQSVRRGGQSFRIALRPVEIGGVRKFQAEMTDEGRVQVKNFDLSGAASGLEEILAQKGARDLHLLTGTGDIHVRVTKKGHVLVSRSAPLDREVNVKPHDRVKNLPLNEFAAGALLRAIGLADGSGAVRASMRGKYDQVNEFLKTVKTAVQEADRAESFTIVDCGCGKAYLTFAVYFYLVEALKFTSVRVIGIDRRADVIAAARRTAAALDVGEGVSFVEADLADFDLKTVGCKSVAMVISLHACDTATDEALARGVEWGARYILSAPCCQHELQKALASGERQRGAFGGLLRQSILRERLCDILTDAFRAMILRLLGYKVQVIEFVSSEATMRNIMLRCEYGVKRAQAVAVGDYLALRDYWRVTPWLETRLAARLKPILDAYGEQIVRK